MIFRPKFLVCLGLAVGLCAHVRAGTRLKVIGDRVNLRSQSGGGHTAEVVSQVNTGDELVARSGLDGAWVEVEAPATASVWVYEELVKDGVVAATKVRVRGGPDVGWQPVGRVTKGDRLTVRGRKGDWLEIAPPPGTSLWISRDYVEPVVAKPPPRPVPKPVPKPPVKPVPPPKPVPEPPVAKPPVRVGLPTSGAAKPKPLPSVPLVIRPSTGSRLPVGLAGRTLVPSKPQGSAVQYGGIVHRSGLVWRRPSRFRLAEDESGRALTMCYLLGNEEQLGQILGRRVTIHGREYWVQGVRSSVVVPERIVRH